MDEPTCTAPDCGRIVLARSLCSMHYQRFKVNGKLGRIRDLSPQERFLAMVDQTELEWRWTGALTPRGYGRFKIDGRTYTAHHAAYLLLIGPVPPGMEIDHACHTRDLACPGGDTCPHRCHVNPFYCLEPVPHRENTLRGRTLAAANIAKTHCPQNHPYDAANTYTVPGTNARACRECQRKANARYKAKKRAQASPL